MSSIMMGLMGYEWDIHRGLNSKPGGIMGYNGIVVGI
jgi:hypothetical protein